MKRRFLQILILGVTTITGWAQGDNSEKLSVTTQMFLHELSGDLTFERDTKAEKQLGLVPVDPTWNKRSKNTGRIYATPDTIDGRAYIAAYLRLNNASDVSEVESLGVILQSKFNNGLYTSLIPVDKINEVAGISNVKRINVSPLKKLMTKAARQKTNVDDLLTLSADAISAGLATKYDGTGVVLGIIDTGIDFNHIAFKDKNGNSRIKKAYVYNGSNAQEYSSISSSTLTDDKTEDHGTHTSSTAGGSSVTVSGTTVTVTDDHANATYGGMAPGTDLYLAGINGLSDTYLSNAVNKMCTYADQQGKPLVVSNSWGSQFGPHDGTGDVADVYNSLFGDSHPNRIALFAASNDGGKSKDNEGGGYHVSGTASSSSPLRSILRSASYINTDAGYYYYGIIANAWCRSTSVSSMTCKIYVLDNSTGAVKTTVTVNPTTSGASVSGLSTYYSGTLYAYKDYVSSNKAQVMLYTSGLTSRSTTSTTKNGETYYKSNYTLAIEFAPSTGSATIDVWGGSYGYFTNYLTTSGYNWKAGSDDMSVSDEAMISNVISVGAYVSANQHTDYSGTIQDHSDEYTIGDIAYFSSYATAAESSTGLQYPWITAPGARLAAGVNHNHTTSVDDYSYYGSSYNSDLVVNSSSNPYAMMEGTSMATPCAAGIVALWLQASQDANAAHKNLTVNDVKAIMQETAINDSYTTTGANASHFGKGKIDALAGIQYILGASAGPTIRVSASSLSFTGYATVPQTQTVTVTGLNLERNISVTKSGSNVFSVTPTTITAANAANGVELTITWAPTAAGTQTGTITLSSTGAESVTISLTGTAEAATPTIVADKSSLDFSARLNQTTSQTVIVSGRFLTQNVIATLNDQNGVFSVDQSSFAATEDGTTLTVSFNSTEEGTYSGTLVLSSQEAESVTISLSGMASDLGSASDAFLNIAKYATIDEAGWNTNNVNTLYKYTEYENDEVAWLTLPVYGAWVGTYYNNHPQKWIESNVTSTSNAYAGTSWNSSEKLLGSSSYFTSTTARGMGYNSRANSTQETVNFYVTNTTAVELLGLGQSRTNSTYPATLKIYECTVNNVGGVSASSTPLKSESNSATSGTFVLSASGLDASKIYKVEAATYRSYICEIGFQTPIEVSKEPEIEISLEGTIVSSVAEASIPVGTSEATTLEIKGSNLKSDITVTLTGDTDAFTISKQTAATSRSLAPKKAAGNSSLTITSAEAEAGTTVIIGFAPIEAKDYAATLTLSTEGADDQVVQLTGTGLQPELIAYDETLTFADGTVGEASQLTFEILGENLAGDVTATLTDEAGVFSISPTTISAADAEEGAAINVTFAPTEAKEYTATITLSSPSVEPVTVNLVGSATPAYFDVKITSAQIATMYLDFAVTIPFDEYDGLLAVAYVYDTSNASNLRMARINSTIPPRTGVIIYGSADTYRFPKTREYDQLKHENKLTGTLVDISPADALLAANASGNEKVYTLGHGTDGYINFLRFSGSTIHANRAFLIYDGSANARSLSISWDGDTTTDITRPNIILDDDDEWFTLQGMRLAKRPTRSGLYIHHGEAVIVK